MATILESLARLIAQGTDSVREGARTEARRVLDVLVERGDLSRAEADEIQAAVGNAAQSIEDQVFAPIGRALQPDDTISKRLTAIEERLARIESALASRDRSGT